MATIREYEQEYRRQGYPVAVARSRARADRAQELSIARRRQDDADAALQAAREQHEAWRAAQDYKNPTSTEWPGNGWDHARSRNAAYDGVSQTLRIWWTKPSKAGDFTEYYDVPPQIWETLKDPARTPSTGKFVNAVLNGYDYTTRR